MSGKFSLLHGRRDVDMTQGSIMRHLITFAIPLLVGNIFQQLYNMVDTWVVGNYVSNEAFSAVGSVGPIINTLIGFFMGLSSGAGVVISQYYGAKRADKVHDTVHTAMLLTFILSVLFTGIGIGMTPAMLRLMDTPAEVMADATAYLTIYFAGVTGLLVYNMGSGILRAIGDSQRPFYYLVASAVTNTVLDLVFVLLFHMGVEGPAIATVLAQGISGVICLWYMRKKFPILHATRDEWKPEPSYMAKLCYIGIPMGLQYSVTAIGTLVLQAAINGLGAAVVAGVTAAQKINAFISCPVESLGQTMAPYTGQNMGAGKLDRIGKGLKSASLIGFLMSAICFVIAALFGKQLTLLFVDAGETAIIAYSYEFLLFCTGGYCLLTLVNTVRFTIQGMGFSVFAICSGVMEMIARILASTVVAGKVGFIGICLAHPLAWLFADIFLIPAFFWCRKRIA